MRRQLLNALPQLAHLFGLMPWDLDRLTEEELTVFVQAVPREGSDEQVH